MSHYRTLRAWSLALIIGGVFSIVSASIGVFSWAVAVEGLWDTLGVILLGAPVALMLAAWPFALGQALRAIADIGDAVGLEPLVVGGPDF
jgi:hypothetical protein